MSFQPESSRSSPAEPEYHPPLVSPPLPPQKNGLKVILLGCGFVGMLFVAACLFIGVMLYRKSTADQDRTATVAAVATYQQGPEKWAKVRKAFLEPFNDLQQETEEITQLVRKVNEMDVEREPAEIREVIDPIGFTWQMERSGKVELTFRQRRAIDVGINRVTWGPQMRDEFEIVSVEHIAPNEAMLYLKTWWEHDSEDFEPHRWWLLKTDDGWRMTNWERLFVGISEVEIYSALFTRQGHPFINNYYRAMERINEAWTVYAEGNTEQARQLAHQAKNLSVHGELLDYYNYELGELWKELEEWKLAQQAFDGIRKRAHVPGLHYHISMCFAQTNEFERAVAAIIEAEEFFGYLPNATRRKVHYLLAVDAYEEAVAAASAFFDNDGFDSSLLVAIAEKIPVEKVDLIEPLLSFGQADQVALEFALRFSHGNQRMNSLIEDFVAAKGSDAARSFWAASKFTDIWNLEQAAQKYLIAYEGLETDDQKSRALSGYLDAMATMNRFLEAYQAVENKQLAFDTLVASDDYNLPRDQLEAIVESHRKNCPDSAALEYYVGTTLDSTNDIAERTRRFQQGLAKAIQQQDTYWQSVYEYQLQRLLAEQGEFEEALALGDDMIESFRNTCFYLLENDDHGGLAELVEMFPSKDASGRSGPWYAYYHSYVLENQGRYNLPTLELARVLNHEDASSFRDTLYRRFAEVLLKNEYWPSLLMTFGNNDAQLDLAESFQVVATELIRERNEERFQQLLAMCVKPPLVAERKRLKLRWAVEMGDFDPINQALESFTEEELEQVWSEFHGLAQKLFDAYVAEEDYLAAHEFAVSLDEVAGQQVMLFESNLRLGKIEEARESRADMGEYFYSRFFNQNDFFFEAEKFQSLREEFPVSVRDRYGMDIITFLFNRPDPKLAEFSRKLGAVLGTEFREEPVAIDGNAYTTGKVLHSESGLVAVSTLTRPFESEGYGSEEVELPTHQSSIVISANGFWETDEDKQRITIELAKALFQDDCVGIYFEDERALVSDPQQVEWTAEEPVNFDDHPRCYLFVDGTDGAAPTYWKRMRRSHQWLKKLKEADQEDLSNYEVLVQHRFGSALESIWYPVEAVVDNEYSESIRVRRNAKVHLDPVLPVGEPMLIPLHECRDWRVADP